MLNKNYEKKSRMIPYVRKINLNNDNKSARRKPPKFCLDCKETDNCVKLFSNKVNKIEELVDNLYNNQKKKTEKFSIYNAKFTLNNIPCEIEYDLANFTLDELEKLGKFTIQNFIEDKNSSSTPYNKNENENISQ
ncbi:1442_t:CDS:1 [Funneliformis geosporum]|uniref:16684_t:CDS:1 n=1 Tax=Funneliformis geosporum TaxID=1117311 RepID=A0A9W4S9V9_9GLOM|nr:16684_t:CDS:1 [Funneliformis geosporum]CAI2165246.1 1442_t:CDS:1 [Funneliformis geosporum]